MEAGKAPHSQKHAARAALAAGLEILQIASDIVCVLTAIRADLRDA